jgi:hypothetical protein
MNILIRFLVK